MKNFPWAKTIVLLFITYCAWIESGYVQYMHVDTPDDRLVWLKSLLVLTIEISCLILVFFHLKETND